jgi:hypothetical protein
MVPIESNALMNSSTDFSNDLKLLHGLECWGVLAGEGTGSHVTLDFGRKIERARPLRNPTLPDSLRHFKGEFGVFIQNCAWRLETDRIVCSSKTPNDNQGAMVRGLQMLIGQHIVTATAMLPGHDLVIEFSGPHTLRLFCDCFSQENDGDNYSLHTVDRVFTVQAGGVLSLESRRRI